MEATQNKVMNAGKSERHTNLELLRVFATLFVVVIHYNNAGGGKAFIYTESLPSHYQILLFFEMAAICAVDVFVMISGYFLCTATKVNLWKIARLFIDVIFFSVLRYFLYCLFGDTSFNLSDFLERFIPLNWYVAIYSGLYLLFPFLNQILRDKNRSQFRFMLVVFFFVLSVWPSGIEFLAKILNFSSNSLSPISNQGSGDGYTLVNFILMYFLGAYYRMYGSESVSAKTKICAILVYTGCTVLNMLYANIFFGRATSYCNPFVVVQTIAIFVFFQNMHIKSKAINTLASGSFGVYLMHSFFFPYCQIERFVTGSPFIIPAHIIATAILIYAACAALYFGYQKLLEPVFVLLQKKMSFLSYDINGLLK